MTSNPTSSCPHFAIVLEESDVSQKLLEKYASVVNWSVNRYQSVRGCVKRRKVSAPSCGTCGLTLARTFACLHCVYTGCWLDGHVSHHLKENDHDFCVDATTGVIFCNQCNDFMFAHPLNKLFLETKILAEEKYGSLKINSTKILPKEVFKPWVLNEKDVGALKGSQTIPCQARRGLLNLGQTCFLNAVLQCFVHNPLLRSYYLADKHNPKQCKFEQCTSCEMDKLFTEIYSEDSTPHGPVSFLATSWHASPDLAGYAQQDAHEFFMNTLNAIHLTSRGSTNVHCNCIIHSTFAGQLQSDVKCERCGNVTSTVDPMLDVSLDFRGKGNEGNSSENTLAACLRRFTQPEKLGAKYTCKSEKCSKSSQEASKRLTFRKLPPVLCFQFKRFEHKTADKNAARKIDTPIRFPASLCMAPYTTFALEDPEKAGHGIFPGPAGMFDYDLFAVINHEGNMDNGHYTNFARFQDEWCRFDDDKVTSSTLGTCLDSPAYMCFYVKRYLDYKVETRPTYVIARETEALREKEKEKENEKEKEAARMKEVEDALLATV
ncbi:Ubiquitin carboxyl-terminal hydrolase 22 [Termitomyces sp. T112]|nr:Ubiquitin carboxyl-terminal hydrolase 22 [Termitomyces sp. T112]KAH0585614.1 hypothetical protein H2248_008842 [Termitomyces sp. 'cryptogamus']